MSYEGFKQLLCERGHRIDVNCYEQDPQYCDRIHERKVCGKPIVFGNSVDETNGDHWGVIPDFCWEQLKIADKVEEECGECHQAILVGHARYRAPTDEELLKMRYFFDPYDDEFEARLISEYNDG